MAGMKQAEIAIPRPFMWQRPVLAHTGSCVAFCGRRSGKTQTGIVKILRSATTDIGLYWWVGLSWRSASMKRAWRLLKYYTRRIWRAVGKEPIIREADKEVTLPNGSSIWLRSAENPDSLAGEAVKGVVVDEFSLMSPDVWYEYIEGTLLDSGGWAMFIGVPKGNNWAAILYRQALTRAGWLQVHATTYDNPHIPRARIDEIKGNVPDIIWRQEYLAEIIESEGAVFRNIEACATLQPRAAYEGEFIIGIDWAQKVDSTVLTVIDRKTKQMVDLDRFNGVSWGLQRGRVRAMWDKWQPIGIYAEENSIGSPNIEALQSEGMRVIPFQTTAQSKQPLIESLALAFEREEIHIINDGVLTGELAAYERKVSSDTGRSKFSAPEGLHDDCVMSLALAWHGVMNSGFEMSFVSVPKRRTVDLFDNMGAM